MRRILVFILIYSVVLKGINPPQTGDFPLGFWYKMEQQGIGQVYGDPGWLRKIADWKTIHYGMHSLNFIYQYF